MTSGWTEVFHGGLAEALIVQSKLEAFDIPTLLPGRIVREIDPFITGAGPLSQSVEVPPEAAEEARVLLAERGEGVDAPVDETPDDPAFTRLTSLGKRLRWAAVFGLFIPILPAAVGIWIGVKYLFAVRHLDLKPTAHAWNVVALVFCVVSIPISIQIY